MGEGLDVTYTPGDVGGLGQGPGGAGGVPRGRAETGSPREAIKTPRPSVVPRSPGGSAGREVRGVPRGTGPVSTFVVRVVRTP